MKFDEGTEVELNKALRRSEEFLLLGNYFVLNFCPEN